ncbi:FAD-binding and (Fe-S)-binding domain-containing protein [Herbiconiux sp. SYSU D00978]|uniref:FAD-binding and (Fe-S)-binding domain-containing protein n=1 Tax=Herbiconiux sp. SYSU D00978 TaxID=2812562 RepID=UPI0027DD9E2A|nr:FAD-binding and (Fe-S)-binding domain-containing protein [Herbiconiux sp. SYSU D00978]
MALAGSTSSEPGIALRSMVDPGDPRLAAELTAAVGAAARDVSVARFDRIVAGVDASHFLLTPQAVITARSADQVAAVFRYAREHGRAVTLRSGGTSLSGQGSGEDVLLDTRAAFRGIRVEAGGTRVRVEPGATVRQVNARLLRHGRKFGPDPASEIAATIGGVVANNSSGMACGTEHNSYRTLRTLRFVLPSGTLVDTAADDADDRLQTAEPELHAGLLRLRAELLADPDLVEEVRRQYRGKNTMGYGLNSLLDFATPVEILAHLMVGSEGSLGWVAEAEFETVAIAPAVATALVFFDDLDAASRVLPVLVQTGAATIELMDAASLRVVQADPASADLVGDRVLTEQAALLIEYQATDDDALRHALARAQEALAAAGAPALEPTTDPAERAHLWHVRKGLYAAIAGARPAGTTALLEDIAVPVAELGAACRSLQQLFTAHGYADAVIFGHAKDGNIHFLITEDFTSEGAIGRQRAFTEDLVALVLGVGGTLKAEHGTGRIMAPFVERQFGPRLYRMMREVKRLCDPLGILNPGVLVSDDPEAHLRHLKLPSPVEAEVDRCVECGYCEPVCPSRDLTLTPRQRIAVRRARASALERGDAALDQELARAEEYDSVQTCAVDGMCETACPVSINTGDLVRRLRGREANGAVKAGGRAVAAAWGPVTRAGSLALSTARALPAPLVTGATDAARAVLGTDLVPRWSPDLPGGGRKRTPPRSGTSADGATARSAEPSIVFFAACVGSMFGADAGGVGAAEAFRRLCARAGVAFETPQGADDLCCGTPWKSKGLSDGYAAMVQRTVRRLVTASDGGRLPIVSDNSSCTEGLLHAVQQVRELDGRPVTLTVVDSVDYAAAELLPKLPVTEPIGSLALHPTCSSTRLGSNASFAALAAALSTRPVVPDAWGCCGFAGDRGMLHPELTASATAAEAAEVAAGDFDEHVSCNRTCEIGMSRATGAEYRHILELLEERTRPAPVGENGDPA